MDFTVWHYLALLLALLLVALVVWIAQMPDEQWYRVRYQIRNWRAHWRALVFGTAHTVENAVFRMFGVAVTGRVTYRGELSIIHYGPSGEVHDLGVVSKRVVTTVGCEFMVDDFDGGGGTNDITLLNFHDSGTGTNAEAVGDTDLQTPAGPTTRATGTKSQPTSVQFRSVATITYAGTLAITEHGLFNQATRGAGSVLWDRSVFAAVNVENTESIQFTYTLTVTAGG